MDIRGNLGFAYTEHSLSYDDCHSQQHKLAHFRVWAAQQKGAAVLSIVLSNCFGPQPYQRAVLRAFCRHRALYVRLPIILCPNTRIPTAPWSYRRDHIRGISPPQVEWLVPLLVLRPLLWPVLRSVLWPVLWSTLLANALVKSWVKTSVKTSVKIPFRSVPKQPC